MSRPKPNQQVLAEASEWFVAFRFEEADAAARERFGQWLRRSPEHIQAYLEITGVWAELPHNDPDSRVDICALITRARVLEADIVRLAADVVGQRPPKPNAAPRLIAGGEPLVRRRPVLAAAALFACLLPLSLTWVVLHHPKAYTTETGEQRSITLPDGSTVDLNAQSELRIHFSQTERAVELVTGQALFKVAQNKARPFRVVTGNGTVTAVGTEFDVYRKTSSTLVTVLEGRVALDLPPGAARAAAGSAKDVRSEGESVSLATGGGAGSNARPSSAYLAAGEQAVLTAQASVRPQHPDVQAATAWVHKKLVFESTPLEEVADEFNRYNTRALRVDDPELKKLGISGVYSSTDPASLLRFLRDQPGVVVVESEREIRITRKLR